MVAASIFSLFLRKPFGRGNVLFCSSLDICHYLCYRPLPYQTRCRNSPNTSAQVPVLQNQYLNSNSKLARRPRVEPCSETLYSVTCRLEVLSVLCLRHSAKNRTIPRRLVESSAKFFDRGHIVARCVTT